jgi:hypothetical protein
MRLSAIPANRKNSAPVSGAPAAVLDDPETRLRSALAVAIKLSPRSRQEIAEAMEKALGRPITLSILNSWTSRTKKRVKFPAAWVRTFSDAAMNDTLQLALLSPEHRTRLEIKKDLESLRSAITALLLAEGKKARAKNPQKVKGGKGKK